VGKQGGNRIQTGGAESGQGREGSMSEVTVVNRQLNRSEGREAQERRCRMRKLNANQKQWLVYGCLTLGVMALGAVAEMLYLRQLAKIGKMVCLILTRKGIEFYCTQLCFASPVSCCRNFGALVRAVNKQFLRGADLSPVAFSRGTVSRISNWIW